MMHQNGQLLSAERPGLVPQIVSVDSVVESRITEMEDPGCASGSPPGSTCPERLPLETTFSPLAERTSWKGCRENAATIS